MSQQIIGVQRVLQNRGLGKAWNKKLIRWSIVHNSNNKTMPYDIELQMVLLSSKRIVRVNGQMKDTRMCSFGYEVKFDIGLNLCGQIRQDSLSFQLFVNNIGFTKLQQLNKTYQPPRLELAAKNTWQMEKKIDSEVIKKPKLFQNDYKQKKQTPSQNITKIQTSNNTPKAYSFTQQSMYQINSTQCQSQVLIPQLKHKAISSQFKQDKKVTETAIKDTQNELMRILMEEKRKKKQEQQANRINGE